jgi:hypothetical protein
MLYLWYGLKVASTPAALPPAARDPLALSLTVSTTGAGGGRVGGGVRSHSCLPVAADTCGVPRACVSRCHSNFKINGITFHVR